MLRAMRFSIIRWIVAIFPGGFFPLLLRAQEAGAETTAADAAADPLQEGLQWLTHLMRMQIGENTSRQLLVSFGILLVAFIFRKALVLFVFRALRKLASKTRWQYDDELVNAIEAPAAAFVLVVGIFLAATALALPPLVDQMLLRAFQAATLTILFWGVLRFVDLLADMFADGARERDLAIYHFIPLLKRAARVFLIIIGVILVIQNLGYSVGSLLTGLGIGGLAVALAAQESLGNFFGSVSIAADRPFKVGDWIQVGNKIDGDVEEIGLRSTKVRTWAKSQLTIPNKLLANEIIENWSRMPKRRVKQVIGVTYESKPEEVEALVEDIRRLLREDEGVHQEFILVNFTDFGAHSLDILVYYFTKTTKWLEHMDIRQRINLKIMRAVEARGLAFAFPTQTLYFEGEIARRMAGEAPSLEEPGSGR
ncbi:MAG: mechanosensitive ion channel family protein [Verrucomicrobia bacterium]|nr:MAG: mechanosensitive ion channel family protein [Verrucomicrobiota bacterium]